MQEKSYLNLFLHCEMLNITGTLHTDEWYIIPYFNHSFTSSLVVCSVHNRTSFLLGRGKFKSAMYKVNTIGITSPITNGDK